MDSQAAQCERCFWLLLPKRMETCGRSRAVKSSCTGPILNEGKPGQPPFSTGACEELLSAGLCLQGAPSKKFPSHLFPYRDDLFKKIQMDTLLILQVSFMPED